MVDQIGQDVGFEVGQFQCYVIVGDDVKLVVQMQWFCFDDGLCMICGVLYQCLGVDYYFFELEGFYGVIIGFGVKICDFVGLVVVCGQDQYGYGYVLIVLVCQYFDFGYFGQVQIQN